MHADPLVDTIFAPASGSGRAAIAVVRISGPGARRGLERLTGSCPPPRRLVLRTLRDTRDGGPLDQALVVYLPGPASFTGEDQAELHVHGGLAVRAAVLEALGAMEGYRLAEPGEFTRRALSQGRLDLSAAEGLADLIEAETQAQRRQALRQMGGALQARVEAWRERLIQILARLEAALDFSDEGDVAADGLDRAVADIAALRAEAMAVLADGRRGERLREGCTVVIAGPPNAGKSSLINALARRDVAIVSPLPGTTRDAIEVRYDLGGLPVTFVDTAGIRETADGIEREGVRRARARLEEADLVLWLQPVDDPPDAPPDLATVVPVWSKIDRGPAPGQGLALSAETGAGLAELQQFIQQKFEVADSFANILITRERHRAALLRMQEGLERAERQVAAGALELAAEDCRLALRSIGTVTGRVDVDEVLDRLFATFCIGK